MTLTEKKDEIRALIPERFAKTELQDVYCAVMDLLDRRYARIVDAVYPDAEPAYRDFTRRRLSKAYKGEYPFTDLKIEVLSRLAEVNLSEHYEKEEL